MVHLEGMGLVGCLLAVRLEDQKIGFTWNDDERQLAAWRASTGCCYPSDDPVDAENYWRFEAEVMGHPYLQNFCVRAAYGFARDRAPHFTRAPPIVARIGPLRFLQQPSYHLNVQRFVAATRRRYADQRRAGHPSGALLVHAHGFHRDTPLRYFWGWHVRARLALSARLREAVGDTVCLNLQHMRYGTWYAYPVAGEPALWFLGSSLILQRAPRRLRVLPKLARMVEHLQRAADGEVQIEHIEDAAAAQGWRPQPTAAGPLARRRGSEVFLRPQYASGFRHHPALCDALLRVI